jgi:hypothetical protein
MPLSEDAKKLATLRKLVKLAIDDLEAGRRSLGFGSRSIF